ncbi:S1 family peptidase [Catellatospora vulcania]|uniref:S1 family peptidase n=1 Tax=Catellatospora vulcania TaxID=1460450 RepID=UPI0012D390B4|nr:S1 family peptidase [Catellatospora vulcania]
MPRPRRRLALTLAALLPLVPAAPAAAAPPRDPAPPAAATMIEAVQRDFGLTPAQARARLAADSRAREIDQLLRARLGAAYAGSWLTGETLTVAVSDDRLAGTVNAAGATPVVVPHSAATLGTAKSRLDQARVRVSGAVTSWYVDVVRNRVVVTATEPAAAAAFIAASGTDPALVEVRHAAQRPSPAIDIRGGERYIAGGGCSIGFSVAGGYVTAGHCGSAGTWTIHDNGVVMGAVQASTFGAEGDFGWVATTADWTPTPTVTRWNGTDVTVVGAQPAPVNALVCRSGATTGWHCGAVDALNVTVNYTSGEVVGGLTRTTACADFGDSGGPFLAVDHAQGVLSGKAGDCTTSESDTYFQPLAEILTTYGLTLTTSPRQACNTYPAVQTGFIPRMNASEFEPDSAGAGFQASAGLHRACLTAGSALRLELQLFSLRQWRTVATSDTAFGDEYLVHNGAAGKYRYRVIGDRGGASYTFGYQRP